MNYFSILHKHIEFLENKVNKYKNLPFTHISKHKFKIQNVLNAFEDPLFNEGSGDFHDYTTSK